MILPLTTLPVLLLLGEEAEHLPWYQGDSWRIVNLAIFLVFLVYILIKKVRIGNVFDQRAATILKELEQARRDKEEAQQRLAELQERFGRLDQEVEEIRAEAQRESARELERIRQTADADAGKIGVAARREIEGAVKAATTELRAFVAEQSVQMAEATIRREIRPEDDARMVRKYVDELGEVNP